MIKIFGQTDRSFLSNGDVVVQPIRAKVRKEDNGSFYLDLETGTEYSDYLVEGRIVVANTPQGDQAFRINNVSKTRSRIETKAYHVFYDSEDYLIRSAYVSGQTGSGALYVLNNATDSTSPFSVSSDVTHIDSQEFELISLHDAIMAVVEKWGGHLVRDNWNISLQSQIGQDNGVTVRYRKNLKEITSEENWDDVVTKLLPVGNEGLQLPEVYVYAPISYALPYTKTVSFTQDVPEDPYKDEYGDLDEEAYRQACIADLRSQAYQYVNENCRPKVNYTLRANLDRITDIGDTVEVIDERLGLDLLTNVVAYEYDCILKKYTEIEFGNFHRTLSGLLTSIGASTDKKIIEAAAVFNSQIQSATSALSKSVITRTLGADITNLTQDTYLAVNLNQSTTYGDKLSTTSGGGIRIGAGVSKIMVSGKVSYDNVQTDGVRRAAIAKNSNSDILASSAAQLVNGQEANISLNTILVDVSEGDVIYLMYNSPDSDDVIMRGTSMTVETV